MRTEPIMYDENGQLLTPMKNLASRSTALPGADATVQKNFYHLHKVHENSNPRAVERNYYLFIAQMRNSVPGFIELDRRPYTIADFNRHGVEILYAVEDVTLTREQKAQMPRIPEPMLGHPMFR